MPRRESARRNHPLSRECDIVETLHMRLTLLQGYIYTDILNNVTLNVWNELKSTFSYTYPLQNVRKNPSPIVLYTM